MDDLIRRSDAIKVTWQEPSYTDAINALTEARERIKGIPAVEPKKVCIGQIHFDDEKLHEIVDEAIKKLKEEIEPKHGKWIMNDIQCKEDTDNGNYQYTCSECGHGDIHAKIQEVPYCWWCGAKMKGEDE